MALIGNLVISLGFLLRAKGEWGTTWTVWVDLILGLAGLAYFLLRPSAH